MQAIRYTILALALAALPGLAAAQTYGDKAQQPSADKQTTPSAPASEGTMNKGAAGNTAHQKALAACDQKPAEQQQACRDAADAKFKSGSEKSSSDKSSTDKSGSEKSGSEKSGSKPMRSPAPMDIPLSMQA